MYHSSLNLIAFAFANKNNSNNNAIPPKFKRVAATDWSLALAGSDKVQDTEDEDYTLEEGHGENAEEESLDDDPVTEADGEEVPAAEAEEVPLQAPAAAEADEDAFPRAAQVAPGPAPAAAAAAPAPALRMPCLARNQQPNRRHGQHPKSFQCGVFYVKYRDDKSILYPDRIPSWTATCPVHDGCRSSLL